MITSCVCRIRKSSSPGNMWQELSFTVPVSCAFLALAPSEMAQSVVSYDKMLVTDNTANTENRCDTKRASKIEHNKKV